ncbi:MAG TPA: autotransporter-associated beta strand repeat-containing protein, partial [Pirellulales bacterium]|nr:autotransporter-associated beta strand repeat-containing protein [Pirellulales bacterium]
MFTWTGNSNNNWKTVANWTPAGGPPNAVDAVAVWNVGTTGITTNVNLPVTVGSIIINQPDSGAANLAIKNSSNNILTFQSSGGDATFINQPVVGAINDGTSTVSVTAAIQLNSPLDVTSGFDFASNTAVTFSGGITGNQTITLNGGGNLQLTGVGTGFTGQIVINNGAVRLPDNGLTAAGNVTVNNGGQFQLGSATEPNWSLGAGSTLFLNGNGKASGANNVGALRFQNNAATASFDTPIVLQSDSSIYVNGNLDGVPPTVGTVTISQPITGTGALTKNGTGVLVLANDNSYGTAGPTNINGGTLVLADTKNDGGYAIPGDVTVGTATNTNPTVLQIGATGQQLPTTANVTLVGSTATPGVSGTFNLNSFNQSIGSLNSTAGAGIVQNNGTAGNSTLTINGTTVASNYSGIIQDGAAPGTGTLALAFSGPQSLTLSGASTYTGGTTITGGTLTVANTTGSATGTGPVTLSSATLAGTGTISGSVNLVGSTLAPSSGSTTPATLTLG